VFALCGKEEVVVQALGSDRMVWMSRPLRRAAVRMLRIGWMRFFRVPHLSSVEPAVATLVEEAVPSLLAADLLS